MVSIRKPKVDADGVYVALQSAVTKAGIIRDGESYRGSSPEVQAYPGWFISADSSHLEQNDARHALLAPGFAASAIPEKPDPRFRIAQPMPLERQRIALRPITTQA